MNLGEVKLSDMAIIESAHHLADPSGCFDTGARHVLSPLMHHNDAREERIPQVVLHKLRVELGGPLR